MSNELNTPETSSPVQKSTPLCNPSTVPETNSAESKNRTEITQCDTKINPQETITTTPVSLSKMKQKLYKIMHSSEKPCNGCKKDHEDGKCSKEPVNNGTNEPAKAPSSPLLGYIVEKLIKENVGQVEACSTIKKSENVVVVSSAIKEHTVDKNKDIAEDVTSAKNLAIVTPNNVVKELQKNNIHSKIDALLADLQNASDSEDDIEENSFIDTMAEEGEEDTPSEGSNDIIEVGDEINTTESELSSDESYENDSFIDDEENHQLLSGEEYDLELDKPKLRRRIIQLSCESDDEIVKLPKKEKVVKKRKKSRIIRFADSSDDEPSRTADGIDVEVCQSICNLDKNIEGELLNTNEKSDITGLEKDKNNIEKKGNLGVLPENKEENGNKSEDLEVKQNMHTKSPMCEGSQNKIIILENIKIADAHTTSLLLVNNVLEAKIKSTCDTLDTSITPTNNCKATTLGESPGSVTGSARKKRKRRMKEKKNMNKASNEWTEKKSSPETIKLNPITKIRKPTNIFKNYFKVETENLDTGCVDQSKKLKKRKRLDSNASACDEPAKKKKKKNKFRSKKEDKVGGDTNGNIFEDAVHDETRVPLFDASAMDDEWEVVNRTLKPSKITEKDNTKKYKQAKQNKFKSSCANVNNLYSKDFKSLTLYDNKNIKRVETRELLRKKY